MLAIAALVHDRAWILPYWLQAIRNIDWPRRDIALIMLDDASVDDSLSILRAFAQAHADDYGKITILHNSYRFDSNRSSRDTQDREKLYAHLAGLRNQLISVCLDNQAGLQFSVDSDILVHPGIVKALAGHEVPYVSSVVINDNSATFGGGLDYEHPRGRHCNFAPLLQNITVKHEDVELRAGGLLFRHRFDYPMNSLLQVGMSGACYLVNEQVLRSGARFGRHPFGEDAWYCLEINRRGFPVYVDTTLRSVHIMEPDQLAAGLTMFAKIAPEG